MLKLYVVWADRKWDYGTYPNPYTLMVGRNVREVEFRAREWCRRTVKWRYGKRPFAAYYTVNRDTVTHFISYRFWKWIKKWIPT